jgi:hypothetical protein
MTKLDRMTEARDQLERRLKELRADIRYAASMGRLDRLEVLRAEFRETEPQWRALCHDVAMMKRETASLPVSVARRVARVFAIG